MRGHEEPPQGPACRAQLEPAEAGRGTRRQPPERQRDRDGPLRPLAPPRLSDRRGVRPDHRGDFLARLEAPGAAPSPRRSGWHPGQAARIRSASQEGPDGTAGWRHEAGESGCCGAARPLRPFPVQGRCQEARGPARRISRSGVRFC